MARKISKRARVSVSSEDSPLVKVFLITIYHRSLEEPIRVSSDATVRLRETQENVIYGTISNGKEYLYTGFEAALLNDESGAIPQVQITIPNAHRSIIEAIESMGSGPVQVDLQLVFADTPDIVEIDIKGLEMGQITYDETSITGTISRDMLFNEPFPSRSFTPDEWPFLFLSRTTIDG